MKRILALILALAMMLGLTACAGGGPSIYGDKVPLQVTVSDYGFGTSWLRNAVARFNEQYEDYDFGNGKTGVYAEVVLDESFPEPSSGNDIYFLQNLDVSDITTSGDVLDINDIVTADLYDDGTKSIEDKLYEEDRDRYKDATGHYKALPTHETYYSVTYDRKTFEENGLLIAKPGSDKASPWTFEKISDILPEVYFLDTTEDGWEEDLSVGPDGVSGTKDDGLPSSIMEFFTLCDYMKQIAGIHPMAVAGGSLTWYMHAAMTSMFSSLMGGERLDKLFDFNTTIDVVTSFLYEGTDASSPNPFYGLSYLEKPNVKSVALSEETGYYITWSTAKYWAFAWAETMIREGWLAPGATPTGTTKNHYETQAAFLNGGYQTATGVADDIAMLSEGTWWYNESNKDSVGNLRNFNRLNPEVGEQDLRIMPLPTNIYTTVTGEDGTNTIEGLTESTKGRQNALMPYQTVYMCANKNVQNDPAVLNATLKFFEFFHTDEELQRATSTAGFKKLFKYNMDNQETAQGWVSYYKDIFEYVTEDCYVYRKSPNTDTGWRIQEYFYGIHELVFKFNGVSGGENFANNVYNTQDGSAYRYHENATIQAGAWKSRFYCGNKPEDVKDAPGVSYITRGL